MITRRVKTVINRYVAGNPSEQTVVDDDELRIREIVREKNEIEIRRWARSQVEVDPEWARRIRDELTRALTHRDLD